MGKRKKYTMEFVINSSPEFLYTYISTPTGLSAWFADDVNLDAETMTFFWEGSQETARLLSNRTNSMVKFQWVERDESEYFLFQIHQDELTGDTSLFVTDFEEEDEIDEAKMIYTVAVDRLRDTIGG
ncbi:MAG: START-like domain-containing protein [Bacteroidota bacterium]|nr:START-like domain-containing protein [Bacteroidota bacterium]